MTCQVAEEIQDPPWPRSTRIYATRQSFYVFAPLFAPPPRQNLDLSHPLSLQSLSTIWVQSHHNYPLPSLCPSHSHFTNMSQRNPLGRSVCVCQSRKVDKRGKQSLPTKIPCMLQTEMGMEMRRRPRRGQQRGEKVNPPTSYRGLNG